jgi:hypothetical protein
VTAPVRRTPDIIEFIGDPALLGLSLSEAQEALLRSIYGLPLLPDHQDLFRHCTGRDQVPSTPFGEVTVIAGARAGKDSRIAAPVVCYEALFGGHERYLAKGERGVIALVAQDARATRVAFSYVKDYLTGSGARGHGGRAAQFRDHAHEWPHHRVLPLYPPFPPGVDYPRRRAGRARLLPA